MDTLKKFTNVETVTRDFSKTYKNAIDEALPNAKQIVDRFHIFKNLTDDMVDYLKRTVKDKIKIVNMNQNAISSEKEFLNKRQQDKVNTSEGKWETIQEVKKLKREGYNHSQISKKINISRPTVIKYLDLTEPPIRTDHSILDDYIPYIKQLLINNTKIETIYEKIKVAGYQGKTSLLNSHLKGIRQEIKNNTKYLKRSQVKKLFFQTMDEIKGEEVRNTVREYLERNQELKKIIEMVREFKEVIFSKEADLLNEWIKKAKDLDVKELTGFTKLLESDIDAVKNAITYAQYSNGLTEGFNNKTKVIKRQMYGRCGFDLLRLKVLS